MMSESADREAAKLAKAAKKQAKAETKAAKKQRKAEADAASAEVDAGSPEANGDPLAERSLRAAEQKVALERWRTVFAALGVLAALGTLVVMLMRGCA